MTYFARKMRTHTRTDNFKEKNKIVIQTIGSRLNVAASHNPN